jgi:hypothetical protein
MLTKNGVAILRLAGNVVFFSLPGAENVLVSVASIFCDNRVAAFRDFFSLRCGITLNLFAVALSV